MSIKYYTRRTCLWFCQGWWSFILCNPQTLSPKSTTTAMSQFQKILYKSSLGRRGRRAPYPCSCSWCPLGMLGCLAETLPKSRQSRSLACFFLRLVLFGEREWMIWCTRWKFTFELLAPRIPKQISYRLKRLWFVNVSWICTSHKHIEDKRRQHWTGGNACGNQEAKFEASEPHNLATMPDSLTWFIQGKSYKVCKTATNGNDTRTIATGGVHGVYFTRDIVPSLLAVGVGPGLRSSACLKWKQTTSHK